MEERKWILGDDLAACDNLLDGITFEDVILAVHCNCRVISRETVTKQFFEILEQRLLDMNELLNRNIDRIAEEARKLLVRASARSTPAAVMKLPHGHSAKSSLRMADSASPALSAPCRAATAVAALVSALMKSAKAAPAMNGRRKCSTSSAPSGTSGI